MESDDRVTFVIKHLDDALAELDKMDLMFGLYKTQLSVSIVTFVQGEELLTMPAAHSGRHLPYRRPEPRTTSPHLQPTFPTRRARQPDGWISRALLSAPPHLDSQNTIHIPDADLTALSQESLENPTGIERLERAAVSLYKALLSTRDTRSSLSVASVVIADELLQPSVTWRLRASASRSTGPRRANSASASLTFWASCSGSRCVLSVSRKFERGTDTPFQVDLLVNPKEPTKNKKTSTLPSHATMEEFLSRYCGLMLFIKEIDYVRYQQICAVRCFPPNFW